jgi:hypothetical protein
LELNQLLNNTWAKEEVSKEILKYFELNENENATYKNLSDAAKAMRRKKFLSLNRQIIK